MRRANLARSAGFEILERRLLLAAEFGFIDTPEGFAFQIAGTDFQQSETTPLARADSIILWTESLTLNTNFTVEWLDDLGTWHSLSGSVRDNDIANEATSRGLSADDFEGFFIDGRGGNDRIVADGTGVFGMLPGAPSPLPQPIPWAYLRQDVMITGFEPDEDIIQINDLRIVVSTDTDEVDGNYEPGDVSLREALVLATGAHRAPIISSLPRGFTVAG